MDLRGLKLVWLTWENFKWIGEVLNPDPDVGYTKFCFIFTILGPLIPIYLSVLSWAVALLLFQWPKILITSKKSHDVSFMKTFCIFLVWNKFRFFIVSVYLLYSARSYLIETFFLQNYIFISVVNGWFIKLDLNVNLKCRDA